MATYTTSEFSSPSVRNPISGLNVRRIAFTLSSALAAGTSDILKICKLPRGAVIFPPLCAVWSSNDPDSGNNATVSMEITDGTTTKTVIATGNLQAADTALTGTFSGWAAFDFFRTTSTDWYAKLTAQANDVDSGAQLKFVIAYFGDQDSGDTES